MKNKSVELPFETKNSKHLVGTSGDDSSAVIEFTTLWKTRVSNYPLWLSGRQLNDDKTESIVAWNVSKNDERNGYNWAQKVRDDLCHFNQFLKRAIYFRSKTTLWNIDLGRVHLPRLNGTSVQHNHA